MVEIKLRSTREQLVDIIWKSNPKQVGTTVVDIGQKVPVYKEGISKIVMLTENDLHYMPTQEDLENLIFCATKDVMDKLYKPFYMVRKVDKKGKVTTTYPRLISIEEDAEDMSLKIFKF